MLRSVLKGGKQVLRGNKVPVQQGGKLVGSGDVVMGGDEVLARVVWAVLKQVYDEVEVLELLSKIGYVIYLN